MFKKYTYKAGKRYGPYLYENKRVGEKVVTNYVGHANKTKKGIKVFYALLLVLIIAFVVLALVYRSASTGRVSLDFQILFKQGEPLAGTMHFNIKEGEFIPADSKVIVSLGSQTKEFFISDLVRDSPTIGDYYAEDSQLSGSGSGFGVEGSKLIYPEIDFEMRVFNSEKESGAGGGSEETSAEETPAETTTETPAEITPVETQPDIPAEATESSTETQTGATETESSTETQTESSAETTTETPAESAPASEAPAETTTETPAESSGESAAVTGGAIGENEYIISGKVSKGSDFTYTLEEGQTAQIVPGSAKAEGEDISDGSVNLAVSGRDVRVSTDYFINKRGYGSEFLGDYALKLSVDLAQLGINAEQGQLSIKLVSGETSIASLDREISVEEGANESIINETSEAELSPANETEIDEIGLNETGIELNESTNITIIENLSSLELIKEIPDMRIALNGSVDIFLGNYFANAESYSFNASNIIAEIDGRIATLRAEEGFKGASKGKFIAYSGNENLESNEFNVLVSSGALKITTSRNAIRVGEPVKWTKNISLETAENITIELPGSAENISIKKIDETGESEADATATSISGNAISGFVAIELELKKESGFVRWLKNLFRKITGRATGMAIADLNETELENATIQVEIPADSAENSANYIVEYETPAPTATEQNITDGKIITVSAPDELNYTDIIASAEIPDLVDVGKADTIKVYWQNYEYEEETELKDVAEVEDSSIVEEVVVESGESGMIENEISDSEMETDEGNEGQIEIGIEESNEPDSGISITGNAISVGVVGDEETASNNENAVDDSNAGNNEGVSNGSNESSAVDNSVSAGDINAEEVNGLGALESNDANEASETLPAYVLQEVPFDAYDLNGDGKIDYIEWVVPHLSNQTYRIILSNAQSGVTFDGNFSHLTISTSAPYDSLVAYWNFDYDNSSTAFDMSGNNLDGIYTAGAFVNRTCDSGYNDCAQLDGVNDFVKINDNSLFNITSNLTISLWYRRLGVGGAWPFLFLRGYTNFRHPYGIPITSAGVPSANIRNASNTQFNAAATSAPLVGVWHHVLMRYNGTALDLWVDGIKNKSVSANGMIMTNLTLPGHLSFGSEQASASTYFNGTIDDVMIFNTSLTAAQISAIYSNQSARFVSSGEQNFTSVAFPSGENSVNFALTDCETNIGTGLQGRITGASGSGSWQNFVNCQLNNYDVSALGSLSSSTVSVKLNSDANSFYTPIVSGNITLVGADTLAPLVTIVNPTANAYYASTPLVFNVTLNENGTCLYSLDSGVNNKTMQGNESASFGTAFNASNASIAEGAYTFSAYCNDTKGNWNRTESKAFNFDGSAPQWAGNKTNLTAATAVGESVYFNITLTETNPDKYIFEWYNGTAWVNDSAVSYTNGQEISVTKTINIDVASINWTWIFNDTAGNVNQTDVWGVLLAGDDSSPPLVTIASPTAGTTYNTLPLIFNITINEAGICNYSLNSGLNNYTMTGNASNTGFNATNASIADGSYTFNAYCVDNNGNWNRTESSAFNFNSTQINTCSRNLNTANGVYTLTGNINSTGTCLNVTNDGITLNCNGYSITGQNSGYAINASGKTGHANAYSNLNILNCTILNYSTSVYSVGILDGEGVSGPCGNGGNVYVNNSVVSGIDARGQPVYSVCAGDGGNGGIISLINSNSTWLDSTGGPEGDAGGTGGSGGAITLISSNATNATANAHLQDSTYGGNGGAITITNSTINYLYSNGGLFGTSTAGNGGNINVSGSIVIGITALGGSGNEIVTAGTGGNIRIVDSNVSGYITAIGKDVTLNNGGTGGTITITGSLINLTGVSLNVSGGLGDTGYANGASGWLIINYSSGLIDTNALYGRDVRLHIINSSSGEIRWLSNMSGSAINGRLATNISIKNNSAFVDSVSTTALNKSANISLYGLPTNYANPGIFKDGVFCTACYNFTSLNAGNVKFNVSSWTNYSIGERDVASPLVTIVNPVASVYYNSLPLIFNITINEAGICNYSLNSGLNNLTMSANSSNTGFNSTNTSIADGSYTFNAYCVDNNDNWNRTESRAFSYDGTKPVISFINPSPSSGGISGATATLNASITDTNNQTYAFFNDSLVGWWRMDKDTSIGESDTKIYDWSGNGNNGTATNGAFYNSSGKFAGAYGFDGVNDYVAVDNLPQSSNTRTYCAWFKTIGSPNIGILGGAIVSQTFSDDTGYGAELAVSGTNKLQFKVQGIDLPAPDGIPFGTGSITNNVWYHGCATFNTSHADIYLNGNLQDSANYGVITESFSFSAGSIGNIRDGYGGITDHFNGSIDEALIFNRALSAAEIQALYNSSQYYLQRSLTGLSGSQTYAVKAVDNAGNLNTSSLSWTADSTKPQWAGNKTNLTTATAVGESVYFNITLTEANPDKYIFEWYNGTAWVNDSAASYTNGQNISIVKTINIDVATINWTWIFNDTAGNINQTDVWSVLLAVDDNVPPNLSIIYPANSSYTYVVSELNYSVGSDAQSCWYSVNNGQANSSVTCGQNVSGLTANQGSNTWTVYANDSAGNTNSSTITFSIDSIIPQINIAYPSADDLWYNTNIEINYSVSDTNLQACKYSVNNGQLNTTITCGTNITGQTWSQGQVNITIYVNDSYGNTNSSTRRFYIDTLNPGISITYPANSNYTYVVSELNYSVSDANSGTCKYSLDNGSTNTTITCGNNVTGLTANQGSNTWTVYSNDSAGNSNSSTVTFSVDSIIPLVTIASPAANAYYNSLPLIFNITINEAGICLYSLDNGINNKTMSVNASNTGFNASNASIADGSYTFRAYCNDSTGNMNNSVNSSFVVDRTLPAVDFGAGTENDNEVMPIVNLTDSVTNTGNIYVNVSITDANIANVTFYLYNASALINQTNYTSAFYSINFSGLQTGDYRYGINVTDSAGNKNGTALRNIKLIASCLQYSTSCAQSSTCYLQNKSCVLNSGLCSNSICQFSTFQLTNTTIYTLYNSSGDGNNLDINITSNSTGAMWFMPTSTIIFSGKNGSTISGAGTAGGNAGILNITVPGLFNTTFVNFKGFGGYSTLAATAGGNGGILQMNYKGLIRKFDDIDNPYLDSPESNAPVLSAGSSISSISGIAGNITYSRSLACNPRRDEDANNDGQINIGDDNAIDGLYNSISGETNFTQEYDITCDNKLNVVDMVRVGFKVDTR